VRSQVRAPQVAGTFHAWRLRTAGTDGTFFGGKDQKTLFGIAFYGAWATPFRQSRRATPDGQHRGVTYVN
jgi:hypothetical protein